LARSRPRQLGRDDVVGTAQLFLSPWVIIFPGVAVAITVIAVNLFGDELIRALDIRDRMRGA
jgi:peptide/nickel transport system permease protein